MRKYRIIGAAAGWGAQIRACEEGPEALQAIGLFESLKLAGISVKGWDTLFPLERAKDADIPLSEVLPLIYDFNQRLAELVAARIDKGEFPVILGGDHSIAVGTWNGVHKSVKQLGLLWIDAHMDAHTPETTPSGAWHGMPLAALLGFGDPKMTKLLHDEPVLRPENICLIGIRSFEEGEMALLKRLNVKIFFIEEVFERGIKTVLQEAVEHVSRATEGFGVSLDLDVIDPLEAPGVGSPEAGGIPSADLIKALRIFHHHPQLKALEIVEYNPQRNHLNKTAELCCEILKAIL